MTLHEKQLLFGILFPRFLMQLHSMGYGVKIGEVKRTQEQADINAATGAGISNSLHLILLAGDIELYRDGTWLTEIEQYKEAAETWESMHELCTAGYYFGDGHHFSITHEGVK